MQTQMNTADLMSNMVGALMTDGGNGLPAIVNLAKDIALIWSDMTYMFYIGAGFLVAWAVFDLINFKKPNYQGRISLSGAAYKIIGSGFLISLTSTVASASESFGWTDTPMTPYTYSAMAEQSAGGASQMAALWLAILAIVNFFGWFWAGSGVWKAAVIKNKQDQYGAFWEAVYTLIGGFLVINISLLAADIMGSMGNPNFNNGFTVN